MTDSYMHLTYNDFLDNHAVVHRAPPHRGRRFAEGVVFAVTFSAAAWVGIFTLVSRIV